MTIGHNSVSGDQLRSYIERIEKLEEEKASVATDIKEVYAEAKANGYDDKIMRKIVAERKKDANEISEEQILMDTYRSALGMLVDMLEDDE